MFEEATATILDLHEARLAAEAHKDAAKHPGESDVRARHRQLMEQVPEAV